MELLVDTRISFVKRWIRPIKAAFASSSSSSLDCSLTCPASNFVFQECAQVRIGEAKENERQIVNRK